MSGEVRGTGRTGRKEVSLVPPATKTKLTSLRSKGFPILWLVTRSRDPDGTTPSGFTVRRPPGHVNRVISCDVRQGGLPLRRCVPPHPLGESRCGGRDLGDTLNLYFSTRI